MRLIFTLLLVFCWQFMGAQITKDSLFIDEAKSYKPMLSQGTFLGEIPALRDLTPITTPILTGSKTWTKRNYFPPIPLNNPHPLPENGDPLYQPNVAEKLLTPELNFQLNFDGIGDLSGVTPPDPVGDIGKNHYVQMVNSSGGAWFQIWDKQGQSVYGPALSSTIWSQIGFGSIGDPIIQYDHDAQRWLMMEMQEFNVNALLIAISNTSDPTGGWKAYRFSTLGFPDYPKLYVWPDAYFLTVNEIVNGNTCAGFALERDAILNGDSVFKVQRFQMPNYLGIRYQPATGVDWEIGPPPPPGTPGYIMRVYDDAWDGSVDQLQMWEVRVNWDDEAASTLTGPKALFPAPFETKVCISGLFDCIEQPDPNAVRITALENIIMYRAPYQNFGDHESIVLNHVVDVSGQIGPGGDAQVRWYELRRSGSGPWQIHQQGTYGPNAKTNRFMGTLSMDTRGNIGLGYSVCSEDGVFPGLRITGRRSGDPLGEMTIAEYPFAPGVTIHQDFRWGDYSNMAVDPEDGRTFWFTGEYQPASGNWATRIGSFQITRDTYDLTPTTLLAPQPSISLGNTEQVNVRIFNGGLTVAENASVSLFFQGNLVVTDFIGVAIAPGSAVDHVFSKTVAMPEIGKYYDFMVVTNWNLDKFSRNDTLRVKVRHLTSDDVQAFGRANFPGVVCGTDYNLEFLLKNTGALPLQSANIHYKINTQPYQTYPWTGYLAPGAIDTVLLPMSLLIDGTNFFYANTSLPNGMPDQDVHNDSIFFKFSSNVDGAYLEAQANTEFGVLKLELRRQNNVLLSAREFPPQGQVTFPLCTDDGTCYKLVLKSGTLAWKGNFQLLDVYGNVLAAIEEASGTEQIISFCTPTRKSKDVGPLTLLTPQSGSNLSNAETVKIAFRNFGLTTQTAIPVSYRLDGGNWVDGVLPVQLAPGETTVYTFPVPADLSTVNKDYSFDFKTGLTGDEIPTNDQKTVVVRHRYQQDLAITDLDLLYGCGDTAYQQVKVLLENKGIERIDSIQLAYQLNGNPQAPVVETIGLSTGETAEVYLDIKGSKWGDNFLQVYLSGVQDQPTDQFQGNDSLTAPYFIDTSLVGVQVNLFTDMQPAETSFEILDALGNVVYSQGGYLYPNNYVNTTVCLKKAQCYVFRLKDSAINGMAGFVQLALNGALLGAYYGGDFGAELDIPFCTVPPCAGFNINTEVEPASGQNTANGKITVQVSGGALPYAYTLDGINFQNDPVFAGLLPGSYTITCLDANQCIATITVAIQVVGTTAPVLTPQLTVSPNPTADLVWVQLPAQAGVRTATGQVFDQHSKLIQHFPLDRWDDQLRGLFSLEKQPSGVYTIKVQCQKSGYGAQIVKK
jgi:hypothetical protein